MSRIVKPSGVAWDFQMADAGGIEDLLGPNGARTYVARYAVDTSKSIVGLVGANGETLSIDTINTKLPRWKAAVAAVRAGTRNARLLVITDSTGTGVNAVTVGYTGNNMAYCWPYALASYFAAAGLTVNTGSVFGDQTNSTVTATLAANDGRRSFSASTTLGANYTFGGGLVSNSNASSTPFQNFTPTAAFDRIVVTTNNNAAYGIMSVGVDGSVSLQDINLATGGSVTVRTTVSCTLGLHTVNLFRAIADAASTRAIGAVSIETYNSASKSIDILNAAVGGTTTALQSDNSAYYTPLSVMTAAMSPDLTIICLDINDWVGGVTPGTYDLVTTTTHSQRLQKIITACQVNGDVILMTGVPSKISAYARSVQDPILWATRVMAAQNNLPLVDMSAEWGDYVAALAAGYFGPNNDTVHPGATGYADMARRVSQVPGIYG